MGGGKRLPPIITTITMTQCIVYDNTTKESETFCTLTAAKKWMRARIKLGHDVRGET